MDPMTIAALAQAAMAALGAASGGGGQPTLNKTNTNQNLGMATPGAGGQQPPQPQMAPGPMVGPPPPQAAPGPTGGPLPPQLDASVSPGPIEPPAQPQRDFTSIARPNNVPMKEDYMLPPAGGPEDFNAYMREQDAAKFGRFAQGIGEAAMGAQVARGIFGNAPQPPRLRPISPADNLGSIAQQLLAQLRKQWRQY